MRRIIIMIFAMIATMLSFNQKANAQKQVKVPVFEGIVTAKKGNVNIRKEASAQSEKIGTLYADISFYPIISQTEDWYCILIPYYFLDMDNPDLDITDGRVTCGYVSKAYSKIATVEDGPNNFSQMVDYIMDNVSCYGSRRQEGKYKRKIIITGIFTGHYIGIRWIGSEQGRFIGDVIHKGIMVGNFINFFANNSLPDWMDQDETWNESETVAEELTEQQIDNTLKYSHPAILFAAPRSYEDLKAPKDEVSNDNMGVEVMYVDMDNYPFKYETIQFNDDESFSYFVVDNEEYIGIEDSVLVQKCITDLFYTLKYNMWEGKEYRFTDPFGSFLGETDLSLEELIEAYDKKYRSGKKLDFQTLSDLKIEKKKEADGYSYSVRAKFVRDTDKHEYIIMIDITPEKKINSFELTKTTNL